VPLGTLERLPRGRRIWETVYAEGLEAHGDTARAARTAWSAVKGAGYYQDDAGIWRSARSSGKSAGRKSRVMDETPQEAVSSITGSLLDQWLELDAPLARLESELRERTRYTKAIHLAALRELESQIKATIAFHEGQDPDWETEEDLERWRADLQAIRATVARLRKGGAGRASKPKRARKVSEAERRRALNKAINDLL
jgi:hypothetical protein